MTSSLRACIVGLGSIGKRHVRNLSAICQQQGIDLTIDALRHGATPLPPDIQELVRNSATDAANLSNYDLLLLCNPSHLHAESLLQLRHVARSFFVEKPLSTTPLTSDAMDFLQQSDATYYVACPLRHSRLFGRLQQIAASQKILAARVLCSSWLPDWRPEVDYSTLYSAQPESGGVALDLIHEFDYAFTLFGFPEKFVLHTKKVSDLKISVPDTASGIAIYPNRTIDFHVDYIGRATRREIELYTENDTLRCDFINGRIEYLKSGHTEMLSEDINDKYMQEMRYFLQLHHKQCANINTLSHANTLVSLLNENTQNNEQ